MDPEKLPNTNRPSQTNTPNPTDAANDAISEENSAAPGTVVVGGETTSPPTTEQGNVPPPPPDNTDPKTAAFMRDDATPDVPPPPAQKKTGLIVGIIVAAVLLVFGVAAAAYFAFMAPKPDKVLQTALVNTFSKDKVKSVGFEGEMSITELTSDSTYTFDFAGASSQNGQMTLSGNVHIPSLSAVTVDLRSVDGQTMYAKVGGLADIALLLQSEPTMSNYASLLATVDDQWYEISPATLEQFAGTAAPSSTGLSDADRQKLADAYNQNQFLTVKETLADEKIAGVDSYHYKVAIDGAKLKGFVAAVEAANIESLGLTQPLFATLKSSIDNTDLSKYPLDVWIAKDSKLFTQFAFAMQSDNGMLEMKLTLKDYNKDVTVEKPEGAEPIMNVLTPFYQILFGASDLPL